MPYDAARNLTNHPLATDADVKNVEVIRAQAKHLAETIDLVCPDSREKSLAFTNLEQTIMWAVASVARAGH